MSDVIERLPFRESPTGSTSGRGGIRRDSPTRCGRGGHQIGRYALVSRTALAYLIDFACFQKFRGFEPSATGHVGNTLDRAHG
jgi:hypothetical protein